MATYPEHHDLEQIHSILTHMTDKLVTWQSQNDGGWSADPGVPRPGLLSDVWTSAQAALWMTYFDFTRYRRQIDRAINFIRGVQRTKTNVALEAADGGWGWKTRSASDSAATALSVLALLNYLSASKSSISPYLESLEAGRDWMLNSIDPSGGVSNYPGNPPAAPNTSWVGTALAQCHTIDELDHPRISADLRRMVAFVQEKKNGGWNYHFGNSPDPLGTAYGILLLQSLREAGIITQDELHVLDATPWLKFNYQNDDGSWAVIGSVYTVEATSWAAVAVMRGESTSADTYRIWNAINFLLTYRDPELGWARTPEVSLDNRENHPKVWITIGVLYALHSYLTALTQMGKSGSGPR
jgi:hypothetical protein